MMYLSVAMRLSNLFLFVLVLPGCAQLNSAYQKTYTPAQTQPHHRSRINDLLAFGSEMANLPESARAERCKSILIDKETSPNDRNITLQLMVGRLLSDTCGDIPQLLEEIDRVTIAKNEISLQRLVTIHKLALMRIYEQSEKLTSLEHKRTKPSRNSVENKESEKSETRLLREKLEAIRSMEKQLDESSGGN